jgi:CAAX prenyl protease-like protein
MNRLLARFPSLPYIAPFAVFMGFLALGSWVPVDSRAFSVLRLAILILVLWLFSRGVISWRAPHWLKSILLGIAIFLLWIAPDVLFPAWRGHWLFSNGLTGKAEGPLSPEGQHDPVILTLRTMRAVILVPIVEELFWRGWLPRWLDDMSDFRRVPLGSYSRLAFWGTAILFASEHGAMWDVGLAAGVLYNWWMKQTRSLGDLMLAHAVTNACLSAYVMIAGRWEYW